MRWTSLRTRRETLVAIAFVVAALASVTLLVAALEGVVGVPNASSTYLVAVVVAAVTAGTIAGIATAVGGVLLYDFLFTQPVHTLVVTDPDEWLRLVLLLFVGIVVGRLAATQRDRADAAARREQEAMASFRVSHTLALAPSAHAALDDLVELIGRETRFGRVWVTLGEAAADRIAADTGSGPPPAAAVTHVLVRRPGDQPAQWTLVHTPGRPGARGGGGDRIHRVFIELGGRRLGSVWLVRPPDAGRPSREETRLVAAAADQLASGLDRDELAGAAVDAEVARRSDTLKTALLESVSHDLRTPLASIRAAAGNLVDPDVSWSPTEVRSLAESIDRDAERLNALVSNLLDLSRIEGGALHPERQAFVLADLVADGLDRLRPLLGSRPVEVSVGDDLPPVLVDPIYLDQVLTNLVENTIRHAPADAAIRISASAAPDRPAVVLTVEDAGPGVPDTLMPRIFDRFFRVVQGREGARRGSGIGLAVVRGLIEAIGGSVRARRSELGGLAIDLELPVATGGLDGGEPADEGVAAEGGEGAGEEADERGHEAADATDRGRTRRGVSRRARAGGRP